MRTPRSSFALVTFALLATACGPSLPTATEAVPTTSAPMTVTTTAPAALTTTTTPATTTAPQLVSAQGELPPEALEAMAGFYSWLADDRNPLPLAPVNMIIAMGDVEHDVGASITATAVVHELDGGDSVAVAHVDEDIVFMVKDHRPWRIAGAILDGQDPWLGGTRLLLVLGSDARKGENQQRLRADSIHIVAVDPGRSAGSIVGFPRDSWVQGPNGGSKFTNVMARRGPEVMIETTENLTELELDGYVVTGFKGFEGLIRDLGSLTINLPKSIKSGIEGWGNYPSGLQKLGPTAALRLARIRKTLQGGDFARSANHGLIMLAGMIMVQEMGVDELPELMDILLEHAWTDLSTEDLLTMAATIFVLTPEDMINMVMPGSVGTASGQSVVYLGSRSADIYLDLSDGVIDEP
ncbi:MAG: LCP family protein [bacterium]|nr:LCP family protein [bacterium]